MADPIFDALKELVKAMWEQFPGADKGELSTRLIVAFNEADRLLTQQQPRVALEAQPPAAAPGGDGEREELAAWLEGQAADLRNVHAIPAGLSLAAASRRATLLERAATLVRQSAPAAAPGGDGEREELAQELETVAEHFDQGTPEERALERAAALLRQSAPAATPLDLNVLLSPKGAYEPGTGHEDGAQLVDQLEWWVPIHGCDTLDNLLDRLRERILPHLRPPIAGIDVPGPDGDYGDVLDLCAAQGVDPRVGVPLLKRAREAWKVAAHPPAPEISEEVRSAFAELERKEKKLSNFRSLRESLAVDQPPAAAPASDEEREEVARLLIADAECLEAEQPDLMVMTNQQMRRAAALLRQPAPAPAAVPVAVAERPWEQEGWLHPEGGWCWWSACFTSWHRRGPSEVYGGSMLPHWAIPVPQLPQGEEVQSNG